MIVNLIGVLEDGADRRPAVPVNPRKYIAFPRGESVLIQCSVVTSAGVPVDLTGTTTIFTVKQRSDNDPALISRGGVIGLALGTATFSLIPEDTKDLSPGRYVYDVTLLNGSQRDFIVPTSPLNLQSSVATFGAPIT